MTFLIARVVGENIIYTRFDPPRAKRTFAYNYNHDDEVFEAHRNRDNLQAFSEAAQKLKLMKVEARNGFKELCRDEQEITINLRKT